MIQEGMNASITGHFAGFLDTIIDTTGIGLWDWNLASGRVVFSSQWEIIAGYEPGTLPQDVSSWESILFPEDLANAEREIIRHLAGETPRYEAEFRMCRPDGSVIWAQDKGVVTEWDEDNKPARLIGVLQDITRLKETEARLTEQTRQIDFISAMYGLGRWDWDIEHDLIQYDDNYMKMIGYTADELDGSLAEWKQFVHPDDRSRVDTALNDYIEGRAESYCQEVRVRHKDGHYVWTLDTGYVIAWDHSGKAIRLLGGHLDIDRKKHAELRLKESLAIIEKGNAKLQHEIDKAVHDLRETQHFSDAMFDANPYINLIFDDGMHLMDCNPAAVDYFGYANCDTLKDDLLHRIEESIPAFQPDGSPSIPFSKRFEYVREHGYIEFEVEMILGDRRIPMRFTLKKIEYKDTFAIAAYLVDMLSLKEARNELIRQDYLLRQVNRAATRMMTAEPDTFDSTIFKVLKSLGRSVNASRMYIWQNYEDEDGGLYVREMYTWEGNMRVANRRPFASALPYAAIPEWYALLSANKIVSVHTRSITDESVQLLPPRDTKALMLIPVFLQEGFWGFIGLDRSSADTLFSPMEEKVIQSSGILIVSAIVRNQITQNLIVARESALESDKSKSEFLSRMSHEIRTPLNAIIGMTTIAKKSDDLSRIQYSLGKIEAASEQLLEIINDILDMSKIESGKFEITSAPFDLEKMMQNVFSLMQVRLDEKQQNFTFDFENLFTRYVVCDELRLSQVLINLLTNASKFTPVGGDVALRASYRQKHDEVYALHVEVKDSGIGISREQQKRLFRSFEQADGSITRRFGGTGLGLAICKSITMLMGGDIWFESEEAHGSTFIFEVDFVWGEPLTEKHPLKTLDKDMRILVVDDSEDIRVSFQNMLQAYELQFSIAASGMEAAHMAAEAKAEGKPFDVVFLDWMMPGMGGAETARTLRETLGDETQIVMISAVGWDEIAREVQAYGVNQFLAKPILPSMLYDTLIGITGDETKASIAEHKPVIHYLWPGKRILVFEDVEINREILQAILEDTQLQIDFAENGRIGVDMFRENPDAYDLLLMDVQMPELDGLGATREIRAMDVPEAKTIPIIAMTANAFTEDVEKCLAAGMNDHIAKPIDIEIMMKKLSTTLDQA